MYLKKRADISLCGAREPVELLYSEISERADWMSCSEVGWLCDML